MKTSRPGPTSRIARGDILKAARRYYDLGHGQADIAADMGISPSYLARLLKSAKESGWVRVFIDADRETDLAMELKAAFPTLEHVEVVKSGESPNATAEAVATAMAAWFNDLLDRDDAREEHEIWNVAIGGAMPHRLMVDQLVPRINRISVGPTALTPSATRVVRHTAPLVAALLALRLGALPAGAMAMDANRRGFLYSPTGLQAPRSSLPDLERWYREARGTEDYQEMTAFWERTDVTFVSSVPMSMLYGDIRSLLDRLGTSPEALQERGAIAVIANQFVSADGEVVPLSAGADAYEAAFPVASLKKLVANGKKVVLDRWGPGATIPRAVVGAGLCSVLITDTDNATRLTG